MIAKPQTPAASLHQTEARDPAMTTHVLYVPLIHCAGCIAKIESHINAIPGVAFARVNLSRKELRVTAKANLQADSIIDSMSKIGFPAEEIDPAQLPVNDNQQANVLLKRVAVAGFGTMNVMLLSVAVWAGADTATRQFLHLISALVALPILVYSAQPFFANALFALRALRMNMDVPISLAVLLAALTSLYEALTGGSHAYFDAALSLTFFLLAGRYLDLKARQKARSAAAQLARMQTHVAYQKKGGRTCEIPVSDLAPGMTVLVRPSERIPADGVIRKGKADVDRSFLTGEAVPVTLMRSAEVFAGEKCLDGVLEIEVTKRADDSVVSRFIDLVEIAEKSRAKYSALADRASAVYAPLVHLLAVAAFGIWFWLAADAYLALTIAISVLIITCPCALGLAVPAVMTVTSSRLFARGVLLKSATALERIAEIDTIVFDKTGTLTSGRFRPTTMEGWKTEELALLRELADASRHPLARAIIKALPEVQPASIKIEAVTETPGCGMSAKYSGMTVRLGKPEWLCGSAGNYRGSGRLGFRIDQGPVKWLEFSEEVQPDVGNMLARLDEAGVHRILLTGDHEEAAAKMATRLGFQSYHGGMTPAAKLKFISALKAGGSSVMMVGDGINDTGAMAAANAAVVPASALDAARATADVVLLGGNLQALPSLLAFAKIARRRVFQNFAAAGLYNLVAIPLAFAGFVTPLLAAIAMSASSITVVLNAVRPDLAASKIRHISQVA